MGLLNTLAENVNAEFKDVLPAVNAVAADMVTNFADWQVNPVVKASEAVASLVNPVYALDIEAVGGAVALVQALWQVVSASQTASATATQTTNTATETTAAIETPVVATATNTESAKSLQETIAESGGAIPVQHDPQPSHM